MGRANRKGTEDFFYQDDLSSVTGLEVSFEDVETEDSRFYHSVQELATLLLDGKRDPVMLTKSAAGESLLHSGRRFYIWSTSEDIIIDGDQYISLAITAGENRGDKAKLELFVMHDSTPVPDSCIYSGDSIEEVIAAGKNQAKEWGNMAYFDFDRQELEADIQSMILRAAG